MNLNPAFQNKKNLQKKVKDEDKEKKKRKERSDKKRDVKIPLTEKQKEVVQLLALEEHKSPTGFASQIVLEGLKFPKVENIGFYHTYEDTKNYVHAELSQDHHKQLVILSIKWKVSIRQAAYRLLHFMLRGDFKGE